MTPKVGPHVSYGFAPGKIYGNKARMILPEDMINTDNPYLEYITAVSEDNSTLYVVILNQSSANQKGIFSVNMKDGKSLKEKRWIGVNTLQGKKVKGYRSKGSFECEIEPWGISVVGLKLK
jgi:hypothetical protein